MKLPALRKKDKICIIAPAGALKLEDLSATIDRIKRQGYEPILGKHLFNEFYYGYRYSGSPKERLEDFQWALDHTEAKAIWSARGGYGGVQIVDGLDLVQFKKNPKWFIGYSDNTVFHQWLNRENIVSLHGATVKQLSDNQTEESYDSVFKVLKNEEYSIEIGPNEYNKEGNIKGMITGGNLSILYSLLGSKSMNSPKGKILFIEDWQENWYHLDRMLHGLDRAGYFEGMVGLLVGSFTKMDTEKENVDYESSFDPQSYEIISQFFEDRQIPQMYGIPAGHINDNRALVFGQKCEIEIKEKIGKISFKK